jgi:RNA polymerase sigma factor (sigma-70 family)
MTANPIRKIVDILRGQALLLEGKDQSDGQLLERFLRDRDRLALETLVHRHAPMVWGVCRRNLAHDDAEDAFQATFLVLLRKADSIRPREQLANWLYGVAYKTARKARQKVALRYSHEKQMETTPEAPTQAQEDAFEPESLAQLDRALHDLPEKYRTAVVLCALEGKSLRDVALQLRLPPGTVASRLARGREMLAQRLTRHGVSVSATSVAAVLTEQAASGAVPDALLNNTIRAATLLASGETVTAGLLSARVCPLSEGVLRAMTAAKRKAVRVVFLLAGLAMGGGALAYHILPNQPRSPEQPPPAPGASRTDQDPKDPDPKKYGTAAGASDFAKRYLREHPAFAEVIFGHHDASISRTWPSRKFAVSFDPKTHRWTVTGSCRMDTNFE